MSNKEVSIKTEVNEWLSEYNTKNMVNMSTQTMDFEETMISILWNNQNGDEDKAFKRPRPQTRDDETDDLSNLCVNCGKQIENKIEENRALKIQMERTEAEKTILNVRITELLKELEAKEQQLKQLNELIANYRSSA